MNTESHSKLPMGAKPAESLTRALEKSEHVRSLVEESAGDLASVNKSIKQVLANRDPLPEVEIALGKSEAIEIKMKQASEKLTIVNRALEDEVRDRNMLGHQLAAAIEQEEAARYAAFHDVLTGLPNRALFDDRLEHGFSLAKRHGWSLAVMFMDLDDFKKINDAHGHEAGDSVLRIIAQRLKENTRDNDTVSRLGGDEFLYLLMDIKDTKNIVLIAEKIIQAIQAPCEIRVHDINISLDIRTSIGIAVFPKDGVTVDALVKRADEAMYLAKQHKSGYAFSP